MYQVSNQLKNLVIESYTMEYAGMTAEELLESDYIIRLSYKIEKIAKTRTPKYAVNAYLLKVLNNEYVVNRAAEECRQAMYGFRSSALTWRETMIAKIILSDLIIVDEMFDLSNDFDIKKEVEAFKASFIESFNAARQSA